MLKAALRKFGLTDKYTRKRLSAFTARYATTNRTLDIGSGGTGQHRGDFPNCETLDFNDTHGVDHVADVHDLYIFNDN